MGYVYPTNQEVGPPHKACGGVTCSLLWLLCPYGFRCTIMLVLVHSGSVDPDQQKDFQSPPHSVWVVPHPVPHGGGFVGRVSG